jgi:hypothetical protein
MNPHGFRARHVVERAAMRRQTRKSPAGTSPEILEITPERVAGI